MVNIAKLTKKRLGEILVTEGLLTEDQVKEALSEQKKTGDLLGEVLVKLGYVTENDIARTIATQFGLPYIDASKYFVSKEVQNVCTVDEMMQHQLVPMDKIGNILIVAVSGLLNEEIFEELEHRTQCKIHLFVSTSTQVMESIKNYFKAPQQPAKK